MKADITLIDNSTAGNPPRSYDGQEVLIHREPDIVVTGVDGYTSVGKQRTRVLWRGHNAAEMANITDVKIVNSQNKQPVIESELLSNWPPRDFDGGVRFYLLNP